MSEKTCTKCKALLPLEQFHRNKNTADGYSFTCKSCAISRTKAYYEANPERYRAQGRAYYQSHKEEHRARQARWDAANKERLAVSKAIYYQAHRDEILGAHREYYLANKERMNAQSEAYYIAHKADLQVYSQLYRAKHRERLCEQKREYGKNLPLRQREQYRAYNRARYRDLRNQFLKALGGRCYCCGLEDIRFLTIDHVENDGVQERKPNGKSLNSCTALQRMYAAYQANPDRYRAACWNCNCARQYTEGKVCPHKSE